MVPAGTIHAIGAGVVIAEIQQRSDATFRLFDFGRGRELHVDQAIAVAHAGPVDRQLIATRPAGGTTPLAVCPYFMLERIDLKPHSKFATHATGETWLLALEGNAHLGTARLAIGEAMFLQAETATIETDETKFSCLVARQNSSAAAVHAKEMQS
jgi:mannose-6-phosphate isomerase